MKGIFLNTLAHPRLDCARLHPSRRRVLAAPGDGTDANQLTFPDRLGFARPFAPSSPRPIARLRAGRIGGWSFGTVRQTHRTTRTFPDLTDQARISDVIQDSDFRTEIASRKKLSFPQSSVRQAHDGRLRNLSPFSRPSAKYLTSLKIMAYPKKTPVAQFHVDCSPEVKSRFAALHEAFGFKTKSATFEAVVYAVSLKDKIDPQILLRIESKLDRVLENFDTL